MRVTGLAHNLFNVLLFLGIPVSRHRPRSPCPWQGRDRALRPVVLVAVLTFLATSLLFPVATTWGTFLHASRPVARPAPRLGARRARRRDRARWAGGSGWTRPVAWLGPLLAIFASALFSRRAAARRSAGGARASRAHVRVLARADGGGRARRSTARRRSSTTSRSGSPRRSASRRSRSPTRRRRTSSTCATHVRRRVADHRRAPTTAQWPAVLDGARPGRVVLRGGPPPRARPTRPTPAAIEDIRVFRIACAGVATTTGAGATTWRPSP